MTDGDEEVAVRVPCIYYPIWFQKSQEPVKALFNNSNEINAMNSNYAQKLRLKIWKIHVGA